MLIATTRLESVFPVMPMGQIASRIWTCPARGEISRKMCHLQVLEFPRSNRLPIPSCGDLPLRGGYSYQRGIGSAAILPYPELR